MNQNGILIILAFMLFSFLNPIVKSEGGQNEDNYRMGRPSVAINGAPLTDSQIQTLTNLYRIPPMPGNYWYDPVSGLYGTMGQGASGVMPPGLNFAPLPRSASGGTTGVLINGRELNVQEYVGLCQLARMQVAPGFYWLAPNGNIGVQGYPQPLGNLYVAFQAATQRGNMGGGTTGAQGGGDNFWYSGNVSAGGNESGGTGYVMGDGFSVIYDK